MKILKVKYYTVELVRSNPNYLFLFGCNLIQKGKGGQAQIRDEPNAYGIPTKKLPSMDKNAFFTDDEYENNVKILTNIIDNIPYQKYNAIVLPEDGLGK